MATKTIRPHAKAVKEALRVLAESGVIDSVGIPPIGSRRAALSARPIERGPLDAGRVVLPAFLAGGLRSLRKTGRYS